jgi:hypothetical protein
MKGGGVVIALKHLQKFRTIGERNGHDPETMQFVESVLG